MSRFTDKFNKGKKFNIDTTGFEYITLENLYCTHGAEMIYPLTAIYINRKGIYGDAPVFATNDCLVNIPSHMLEIAEEILSDEEAIEDINNNNIGFTIYTYHSDTYNLDCYGVNFVDM